MPSELGDSWPSFTRPASDRLPTQTNELSVVGDCDVCTMMPFRVTYVGFKFGFPSLLDQIRHLRLCDLLRRRTLAGLVSIWVPRFTQLECLSTVLAGSLLALGLRISVVWYFYQWRVVVTSAYSQEHLRIMTARLSVHTCLSSISGISSLFTCTWLNTCL